MCVGRARLESVLLVSRDSILSSVFLFMIIPGK
jgi:hypothetical protein